MAVSYDEWVAKVNEQTTLVLGVVELVAGLRVKVEEALGKVAQTEAVQAKLDEVFSVISENSTKLAEALTNNVA